MKTPTQKVLKSSKLSYL